MINEQMIHENINEYYQSKVRTYPHYTTWASLAGHPCVKFLVLNRLKGQELKPIPAEIQPRLEIGNAVHDLAKREFENAGFRAFELPDTMHDKDLQVSGKLDFEISRNGTKSIPVEVKSMHDYEFDKHRCSGVKDILESKKWYVRKYMAQIVLYCWLRNKPEGILYLKGLPSGRYVAKQFNFEDKDIMDYAHTLMENLKKVNEYVAKEELPEGIEYDDQMCQRCSALHLCLPDIKTTGEVMINEELEANLERMNELAPLVKEHAEIKKAVSGVLKEKTNILVGNYHISGKWIETKAYTKDIKANKYWKSKIIKVEEKPNGLV